MISNVSKVRGTSGSANRGSVSGSAPICPTVFTSSPAHTANAVSTAIAISGEGIALVRRGRP